MIQNCVQKIKRFTPKNAANRTELIKNMLLASSNNMFGLIIVQYETYGEIYAKHYMSLNTKYFMYYSSNAAPITFQYP
jgi:hypothetical protein